MESNFTSRIAKYIAIDIVWNIVYFPVWWYSKGLKKIFNSALDEIFNLERRLGIRILLRNMFKPMYGDYTRSGRIISFFMRIFQLIVFLIVLVFWTILMFLVLVIWVLLPPVAVFNIFYQLFY